MLHIVQVVLSGVAHPPKLFVDKAKAESVYVEYAKKYWSQSYASHCERNGNNRDSFPVAEAFVGSFDVAGTSRINFWSINLQEIEPEGASLISETGAMRERREQILRAVEETRQLSRTATEGLTALLETTNVLAETVDDLHKLLDGDRQTGEPEADTAPLPSLPQPAKPETTSTTYDTPEWKGFVARMRNICGGRESTTFTRHDWRQAVYSNITPFEYWEWVATRFDDCIKKAESAGYSVVVDPDNPGQYRFKTLDGVMGEISCDTEDEAWCGAGLHIEGKR